MKRCAKCGQEKPLSEFYRQATTKDKRGSYCKPCGALVRNAWRAANPERDRANNLARNGKKREWERANAKPCVECGTMTRSPYASRCQDCDRKAQHHRAWLRTKGWLSLRAEGLGNREIAELADVKPHVVVTTLQKKRVARFPDLAYVKAPYVRRNGR